MSGGKGGKEKSKASIPKWAQEFAQENIDRTSALGSMGYLPWTGPDVAAMSGMETQAAKNTMDAAKAFGMGGSGMDSYLPEAQEFAGGVKGYSSFPMFQEAVNNLYDIAPESMRTYDSLITPNTPEGFQGQYMDPNNPEMVAAQQAQAQGMGGGGGGYLQYDPYGGHTGNARRMFQQGLIQPRPGYTTDPQYAAPGAGGGFMR